MTKIVVELSNGEKIEITGTPDRTLMEVIRANGIHDLLALCGGGCSCGTCHIYVDTAMLDRLPGMGDEERELLESIESRTANSRLSCRIGIEQVPEGLRIKLPPA
jgi:2Fe-2S ferredoxin